MLLGFLHISQCVSLEVKAGYGQEAKNYSTLPLIDFAGDYANSYTYSWPAMEREGGSMTGMKCHHRDKQSYRDSQSQLKKVRVK